MTVGRVRALTAGTVAARSFFPVRSFPPFRWDPRVPSPRQPFYRAPQQWVERKTPVQKSYPYEAILLINRGIDEAVRGLERLKRARDSGLDPGCFDEIATPFESHRASLNSYFCNNVERSDDRDMVRFEQKRREREKSSLDEVQVYRDLHAVEKRRRVEGKPPKVRFLSEQEQFEWERQYPKPPEQAGGAAHVGPGGPP
jgi:hypothetical protein